MTIRLFGEFDITEAVISVSKDSASYDNVDSLLAPQRDFRVKNADGKFSRKAPGSYFDQVGYRNEEIDILNDEGKVTYKGLIISISEESTDDGVKAAVIRTRDALGTWLDWPVKQSDTVGPVASQTAEAAGTQQLVIGATPVVGDVCIVSTSPSFFPSYQVNSVTPSGPNQILNLDRGLEVDVANGADLYLSFPSVIPIAEAIKNALIVPLLQYGLEARLGNSFDILSAKEADAGNLLWIFVRQEDDINISKHVGRLLELSGYKPTTSDDGVIDLVESVAWDGEDIDEEITDDEIMNPVTDDEDVSRLLYSGTVYYRAANEIRRLYYDLQTGYGVGALPQFEPGLTPAVIDAHANSKPWNPMTVKGATISGNQYLFDTIDAARFYLLKKLNYYCFPRRQIKCTLKPFLSGQPLKGLTVNYFKRFRLSATPNANEVLVREPVMVFGYDRAGGDESSPYQDVILELINKPTPALPG